MKRLLAGLSGLVFLLLLAACSTNNNSSSSSSTTTTTTTTLPANSAFVSNAEGGVLQIVNFSNDSIPATNSTISVTSPAQMWVSADTGHSTTVVFNTNSFAVSVVNNSTEQVAATIPLCPSSITCPVDSIANDGIAVFVSTDGTTKTAWAAVRGAQVPGQPGAVVELDLANHVIIGNPIPIANARHLALSGDNTTLLVFPDETAATTDPTCGAVGTCAWVISTANPTNAPRVVTGLDRPVAAYFTSDTTALILNCGLNCNTSHTGQPGVAAWTVGTTTPASTTTVAAANLGLLNGSTLWVAGAQPVSGQATVLTPVNVSNTPPTAGSAIPLTGKDSQTNTITIGVPDRMAMNGTSLAVGSTNGISLTPGSTAGCANDSGCLAVVNTASKTVLPLDLSIGNVSGLTSIPNRGVFYSTVHPAGVASSSRELVIIDATTGQATSSQPIDIVGDAADVVVVP